MNPPSLEFIIPGDLQAPTGGYGYDRRIIQGLRALGWQVNVHSLDASFPQPTEAALMRAERLIAALPEQALVLVDGLAGGAMPQILLQHAARLRLAALVHHPLAYESGLAPQLAQQLARSERQALRAMRHVIVTSHATRQALAAYEVDAARISVVEPGTDAAPLVRGPRPAVLRMLCVAALIPRKAHDVLLEALASLASRPWHLTCAGSERHDPSTAQRLRAQLRTLRLEDRVTLAGEVDAHLIGQYYAQADLFVLPTRHEGYGMAVAEALAHGLPVISTPVGAIAELVGRDAGLLVRPDDSAGLRDAIGRVFNEPGLLDSLLRGAARARAALPDWSQSCATMVRALEVAARGALPDPA
jgi:glycosyltransferase involved in cell wall biosynthesis